MKRCPFSKSCRSVIFDDEAWAESLSKMPHDPRDSDYEPGGYPHPSKSMLFWELARQRLIEGHEDSHKAEDIMREMERLFHGE